MVNEIIHNQVNAGFITGVKAVMPSKLQQSHAKVLKIMNKIRFLLCIQYRAAQIFEILGLNKTLLLNIFLTRHLN
jgi:glutamate synthase (ferredoxin)